MTMSTNIFTHELATKIDAPLDGNTCCVHFCLSKISLSLYWQSKSQALCKVSSSTSQRLSVKVPILVWKWFSMLPPNYSFTLWVWWILALSFWNMAMMCFPTWLFI